MASSISFLGILLCFFTVVSAEISSSSSSFGFKRFDKNSKYFWSKISLSGDARVTDNGSFVDITGLWNYSSGKVTYKQPFKLYESNLRKKSSFGSYFVFSMANDNVGSLDFMIVRNASAAAAGLSGNHVVSIKGKNSGEKLQCWIDFEASSKRMEVRISKLGEKRPVSPTMSHQIDLCSIYKNQEVFIGLASANGNAKQLCRLYSWSFKLRPVPNWMHSQPLDPQGFKKDVEPVVIMSHKRSSCVLRVFAALVFGTGCGALGAFIVLCACTVIAAKKPVAPEECVAQPVVFDCDKVKVIVIDKSDNGSRK
ncbi:L-type lectin-domain containing receptor kinase VIII.1-like [Silene latifolia]|uniref:L-type lectin-domain containing receptor kinase VIII.1-like n=1 Tax=Silene latifolia TaxID=37657 RepID=UPI003D76B55C